MYVEFGQGYVVPDILTFWKAITELSRQLRQGNGRNGLVLANGGVMSYQHVVCLSSRPESKTLEYPERNPLGHYADVSGPPVDEKAEGKATIETYTVDYDRKGVPKRAYIVGRLRSNGHRFVANHGDEQTLQQLAEGSFEPVGQHGRVESDAMESRRNIFFLDNETKL